MTLNTAAKEWKAAKAVIDEATARLNLAAVVLKEHFRSVEDREFRGVGYARSSFRALDVGLARAALGPTKTEACTVDRERETLSLVK